MNLVNKLPDTFRKDKDSNNYKLLRINEVALLNVQKDIKDITDLLDIDKAHGKTLDYYGDLYNQKRGNLNDAKYRPILKAKINNLLVDGTYSSIINAICMIFNCNPEDIQITDKADQKFVVHIGGLPLDAIIRSGFSSEQAKQIIKMLLPVCISISSDTVFEGTFELATNEGEKDNNKGLASDDLSVGGTLSLIVADDNDIVLPI